MSLTTTRSITSVPSRGSVRFGWPTVCIHQLIQQQGNAKWLLSPLSASHCFSVRQLWGAVLHAIWSTTRFAFPLCAWPDNRSTARWIGRGEPKDWPPRNKEFHTFFFLVCGFGSQRNCTDKIQEQALFRDRKFKVIFVAIPYDFLKEAFCGCVLHVYISVYKILGTVLKCDAN